MNEILYVDLKAAFDEGIITYDEFIWMSAFWITGAWLLKEEN